MSRADVARGQIILIGGGVRSGKSAWALLRARTLGQYRVFLATAEPSDDEMRERIARHRAERGGDFETIEEPLELAAALRTLAGADVVVVDCLTLWLSNLLQAGLSDSDIMDRAVELEAVLRDSPFHSVLVTNEVGMGVVPASALGRRFRDLAGRLHQILARSASEVHVAALGLVLRIRPGPIEVETCQETP